MVQRMRYALFLLGGLAALSASAESASAVEIVGPAGGSALSRQMQDGQMQALRNQLQRQQFQQQQRQYREQDRRIAPPPVLEVPRIKPTCQIRIYGSNALKTCR
ncbi:MAG: hypothetical protein ABS35_02035 [Kaistia sp. SCN 65-12]|nr:MAG: hypothetical protein ABS35_02035 [Kaistia sp. SCN 65-12]